MKPKSKKDIVFVGLQFLLFLVFVIDFQVYTLPNILPDAICGIFSGLALGLLVLSIFQLNTNLSPFPSPKLDSRLVTSGIFKYVRHPIYTSLIIGLLSWSLYNNSMFQLFISLVLMVLFYYKSKYEEEELIKKFPDYKSYMNDTGRFFPKFKKFTTR